jgi:hypothetical protein
MTPKKDRKPITIPLTIILTAIPLFIIGASAYSDVKAEIATTNTRLSAEMVARVETHKELAHRLSRMESRNIKAQDEIKALILALRVAP